MQRMVNCPPLRTLSSGDNTLTNYLLHNNKKECNNQFLRINITLIWYQGEVMKKREIKNDIVKNLKAKISKNQIKISFGNKIGLGYDGCGTHTHK